MSFDLNSYDLSPQSLEAARTLRADKASVDAQIEQIKKDARAKNARLANQTRAEEDKFRAIWDDRLALYVEQKEAEAFAKQCVSDRRAMLAVIPEDMAGRFRADDLKAKGEENAARRAQAEEDSPDSAADVLGSLSAVSA